MRRAAILGSPIGHSLSPALHRAAYAVLGLDSWRYDAFEVDEAGLAGFIASVSEAADADHGLAAWAGLSLTMPLKRAVIPLLDQVHPEALAVEAVNTVLFRSDGSRYGANTDVPGLAAALAERSVRSVPAAAVLGGGATAASAIAALSSIVRGPIDVYVRSEVRARELPRIGAAAGVEVCIHPWHEAAANALSSPLVVNTTPASAADHLGRSVPRQPGTLFDVLYHPWPTPLAAAWSEAGGLVLGGLDLLAHQAVLQIELMTGVGDPARRAGLVDTMRAAGRAELATRRRMAGS